MRTTFLAVLGTTALAGCTTTSGLNLQRASAHAIVPTPYPDSVVITDLHRKTTSARWVATTPDGVYDCSIETPPEHVPLCVKRETPR
jgi:hypothetical protein